MATTTGDVIAQTQMLILPRLISVIFMENNKVVTLIDAKKKTRVLSFSVAFVSCRASWHCRYISSFIIVISSVHILNSRWAYIRICSRSFCNSFVLSKAVAHWVCSDAVGPFRWPPTLTDSMFSRIASIWSSIISRE